MEAADIPNAEGWTKAKRDKAMRLYPKIIETVAEALEVPSRDLLKLWTKGIGPELMLPGERREAAPAKSRPTPELEVDPNPAPEKARRKPARPGLGEEVVAYHFANRHATARQIAKALNCDAGYVRATAKRQQVVLPTERQSKAAPAKPASKPENLPAVRPAGVPARRPGRYIGENAGLQAKARTAKFYRLRRLGRDGKYLHMSGEGETSNKDFAWIGTAHQARNMRGKSDLARRMRLIAEPAWQPRDKQLERELKS